MRKIVFLLAILLMPLTSMAAEFVHPGKFSGTKPEKERVIRFIQENVKEKYTAIGMGDPMTLRMMEEEELKCFKSLVKVTDRTLLDSVIAEYCAIGMCDYNTILMMYNEQKKASGKSLSW